MDRGHSLESSRARRAFGQVPSADNVNCPPAASAIQDRHHRSLPRLGRITGRTVKRNPALLDAATPPLIPESPRAQLTPRGICNLCGRCLPRSCSAGPVLRPCGFSLNLEAKAATLNGERCGTTPLREFRLAAISEGIMVPRLAGAGEGARHSAWHIYEVLG